MQCLFFVCNCRSCGMLCSDCSSTPRKIRSPCRKRSNRTKRLRRKRLCPLGKCLYKSMFQRYCQGNRRSLCKRTGHYIECREGYDRLLDMESFGGKIRDTERGFNPKKHMLQSYGTGWQSAAFLDQERQLFGAPGGIITDWDLKTNIDGIYAAGDQLYASDCCGTKCKDLLTEGLDLLAQYMRMERL